MSTAMDWSQHEALSARWRAESLAYVAAVNEYVDRCNRGEDVGEPPSDTRAALARAVLDVVEEANRANEIGELRRRFPPAHEPFVTHIKEHCVPIASVLWPAPSSLVAVVGGPRMRLRLVRFRPDGTNRVVRDALAAGRTSSPAFGLIAYGDRLELRRGRELVRRLALPQFQLSGYLHVEQLPGREEALVVFPEGVFVCTEKSAERIFPSGPPHRHGRYPMLHAALSPDGGHLACGWQDSQHHVLTIDGAPASAFGPAYSEYPNHAVFTPDGKMVLASSCHMMSGATVAVDLGTPDLARYDRDPQLRLVQRGATVTAGCFLGEVFVVGDRNGYLRAYTVDGRYLWQHFCGSTVTGLAVSPDARQLAVTTAAGYLQILTLHTGAPDPFQIGTATHREEIRFVCWRGSGMLRW